MMTAMQTVHDAAGGRVGLEGLARAWHDRVIAVERLAAYWAEALGGPAAYSSAYGEESFVVREHSGNGEHEEMNDRAISCFDQALVDVGITEAPLRQVLHDYFAWATTTTMYRYHESADEVPGGLGIPHWGWDGPVR